VFVGFGFLSAWLVGLEPHNSCLALACCLKDLEPFFGAVNIRYVHKIDHYGQDDFNPAKVRMPDLVRGRKQLGAAVFCALGSSVREGLVAISETSHELAIAIMESRAPWSA
jgi:hypothetical protein